MKNRGIIKRLVFGKTREKDFTEDDLPQTRLKQFKFVMRTRFGVILRLSMLTGLFFVPYAVWTLLSGGYVSDTAATKTATEYLASLFSMTLFRYGTMIPFIMLGCVGLAGLMYCIRRICWGQSIRIFADFGKGIKQSWLQFLLLGMLTGIVNVLINYVVRYCLLSLTNDNALAMSLVIAVAALFGIVWVLTMMFAFCQSSLYMISLGKLLFNSVLFAFKRLFRSLLIAVLSLAPILVFTLMPWVFIQVIGYALAALFSLGFAATIQTIFCHSVFDDFINKKSYPDYVRMGLAGNFDDDDSDGDEEGDSEAGVTDEAGDAADAESADVSAKDTQPEHNEQAPDAADADEAGDGGEK